MLFTPFTPLLKHINQDSMIIYSHNFQNNHPHHTCHLLHLHPDQQTEAQIESFLQEYKN